MVYNTTDMTLHQTTEPHGNQSITNGTSSTLSPIMGNFTNNHRLKYKFGSTPTHTHTHTQPFYGSMDFVRDNPSLPVPEKNIHPLTPIVVINHPLSASSVYYDPWHPPCSIHATDSLFPQSRSKFCSVYLLACQPALHAPYISSPKYYLLCATHACPYHRNRFCCIVLRLRDLILVSLSTLYLEFYLVWVQSL